MLIASLGRDKVSGDRIQAANGLCWGCVWTESLHSLAKVYDEFRTSLDKVNTKYLLSLD